MVQVQDGAQTYRLNGRAAAMVRYLAQRAEALNNLPNKMRLEFNCAGRSVRPKLEICEDEVPIR